MKRVFLFFFALLLTVSLTTSVGAVGIEKWSTYYDEAIQQGPILAESPEGLVLNCANYTYRPEDSEEDPTRFGIVYNEKIKLDGFKIEFDIKKSPVGIDAWIALNFFDNPLPMWHDNPESTSGFISLIRPSSEDEIGFEGYQSTADNVFNSQGRVGVYVDDVTNCTLVVEIKRTSDGYTFYMNGEEHPGTFEDLFTLFADDMAYLEITTYSSHEDPDARTGDHAYELLIKSINGEPVVWEEPEPEPEPEPEVPEVVEETPEAAPAEQPQAPVATAPATGDAGMIIFAGIMAAAGIVLLKKKIAVK